MRDLTIGAWKGHVARMAPPAMAGYMVLISFETVDAYWAGRMAEAESVLAALAVGTYALWALYSLGSMVESGVIARVSFAVGARDFRAARHEAGCGLRLALLVYLATVLLIWPLIDGIVALSGVAPDAAGVAARYLQILVLGAAPIYLFSAIEAVFRAWGDTRTPMWLAGGALVANTALDPWLMFGGQGIPALGLDGAAIATIITRSGAAILGFFILRRRNYLPVSDETDHSNSRSMRAILRIGAPNAASGFLYCLTFLLLSRQLSRHGSDALGAFMVGQKAESISWASLVGLSAVASSWVGQNLGSRNPARAAHGAWSLASLGVVIGIICALIFFGCHQTFMEFFAPGQKNLHEHGRLYLQIIAVSQVFLALEIIFQASFSGAGDTVPPMLVIVPLTLMRAPLASLFDEFFGWGVPGIFWAVTVSTALKGLLLALWFRSGRWTRRLVP